ncbi:GNAT family N-acetyltransferase [Fodinicola acaciae]|uniref:GNAT family N-acetyltransferase n=1 Tax=Fodinicola acaciae TaxID=2681555 RepID=UPI0013D05FBA|nr:GNAT family N-acetyltransferase [Fodinicola acaciae]
MQPVIRAFDDGDQEAVIALSLRAWAPVFASLAKVLESSGVYTRLHPDWRVSQREAVINVCRSADQQVWVADANASVIGFVAVTQHHDAGIGEISMLAVDPSHQHTGVGGLLTSFALDQIKNSGMRVAMVETGGDDGHAPARRLYEQAGFTQLPVARYFKKL